MQNNKLLRNKKAISEFALDMISYLFFIATIFIFFLLFKFESFNAVQHELKGTVNIPTSSLALLSYLRTPVMIDGEEVNIAELIRLWYLEPIKYQEILQKNTNDILNKLEYEYRNSITKKIVTRGFQVSINEQKFSDRAINLIADFNSKAYREEFCVNDIYGCINLGEQFIPVSENSNLYIVLRESSTPK